jgi:hypothetical protein
VTEPYDPEVPPEVNLSFRAAVFGPIVDHDCETCEFPPKPEGLTVVLDPVCRMAGEPCDASYQCCSDLCADPGDGISVCQLPSGCRPDLEACQQASDCCSLECAEDPVGNWRCDRNIGCHESGQVCGEGTYRYYTQCCNAESERDAALCLPTAPGSSRCYSAASVEACIEDHQPCAFSGECCGGFCLPDPDGELLCGSECLSEDGSCTTHADCCQDLICEEGACRPNPHGCIGLGMACTLPGDCCSGFCTAAVCSTH